MRCRIAIALLPLALACQGHQPSLKSTTPESDTTVYADSSVDTRAQFLPNSCTLDTTWANMRRALDSASVVLGFIIGVHGRAEANSISVVSTTDHRLVGTAEQILLSCLFVPALKNGHPVRVRVTQPVNFAILHN